MIRLCPDPLIIDQSEPIGYCAQILSNIISIFRSSTILRISSEWLLFLRSSIISESEINGNKNNFGYINVNADESSFMI